MTMGMSKCRYWETNVDPLQNNVAHDIDNNKEKEGYHKNLKEDSNAEAEGGHQCYYDHEA